MKIIPLNKVEKKPVNMEGATGAWKQIPLGSKEGAPVYSLRVFAVEPGCQTPSRRNPYAQTNYIIEGEGALVNENGEEKPIKTGDFAIVDPNEKHQYRNKGNMPFIIICGVPKEFE